MTRTLSKKHWTFIVLTIIILIFFFFILPISIPLVVALITALMLNPLILLIEKRFRLGRKLSVIIIYLLFIIILSLLSYFTVTNVIKQLVVLAENIPNYIVQINRLLVEWGDALERFMADLPAEFVYEVNAGIRSSVNSVTNLLRDTLQVGNIAAVVSAIPNYIVSFLVYLIALFLFMLELPSLISKFYQLFSEASAEKLKFVIARLKYVFFGFIKGQFLVSLIIFAVSLIGLFIIIPEYAIIMSLIIWIIDLIPIIGSIIILAPWSIYMLLTGVTFMGIQLAVLALILLAIRRTVEPKVMGVQMGLSPLATLISMYIGLKLFGLFGFIIGPVVLIVFTSAKEVGIINLNIKI
ncbi:sporulation integral membrane protein YtvI [Amphibacillus sp. MSJ-3]|uniref:sporulation integral membrane protein YtvI n=1 Tax=Amphibacillus sp. MSJ-3 TaxID=2841505 RepID=UPI001C0F171E|nr:sporulation integral membrane protein YtvI [Amphibacillus sp. MSJ-3]MBU5595563.1 sporulation integral membrane protein YtvI [Amphibacillus sp. MSJ-3]